jgi:hypothetical protein
MSLKNLPTKQNYDELSHAYDFFSRRLFGGELPGCLFTLQRKSRSMGYFSFERFVSRNQVKSHEIAVNPEYFATRPVEDVPSTLVHQQVHQWQRRFGALRGVVITNRHSPRKMKRSASCRVPRARLAGEPRARK